MSSDDPLTPEVVEPAVAFPLSVAVRNDGFGTARDLRVLSSQPEIVDNEKGLLVDFRIVGAARGVEQIENTLQVRAKIELASGFCACFDHCFNNG